MPNVYPFRAVTYAPAGDRPINLSTLVAPPYDVLDAKDKRQLLERNSRNIVAIDLPQIPAKELGPPEVYQQAAETYRAWLADSTLLHHERPAMFAYRQTFTFAGEKFVRTGMACTVDAVPFGPRDGGGMLPHEETFSGPKEDRFALMQATATQLSPIFGLHPDEDGQATAVLKKVTEAREPDYRAELGDGPSHVLHEVWEIQDQATINAYRDALAGEDVFIADGHHRYTTALNYLKKLEAEGDVGENHPARRCMIVLVSMSDPGLAIGPTHRVLGGMSDYSWDAFAKAAEAHLTIQPVGGGIQGVEAALEAGLGDATNVLGLYDFASGNCYIAAPKQSDPLQGRFGKKPEAWRKLDVALVQYLVVEQICEPALNGGDPVKWAFPHSIEEVLEIGAGGETGSGGGKSFKPQLAVIVRPTPLEAVREVSRANELMPQKSTFFYPKLATGLFLNPLK